MKKVLDILLTKDCIFNSDYFDFVREKSLHNVTLKRVDGKIYDAVFCLNRVSENIHIQTYPGNIFAVMQESGVVDMRIHRFMYDKLDQYDRVFSSIVNSENTVQDIPYLEWHIKDSYKDLLSLAYPVKKKLISCITSNANNIPGHKKRYEFVWNFLIHQGLDIDFYGRGINYIEKKEDGLLDYKYSLAIENSCQDYYFTEKIMDCFLCYTVPIYCGCTNISKFFPEKSYIQIDIDNPQEALKIIRDTLSNDDYLARLPYLEEARNLIFEKYNLAKLIKNLEPEIFANMERNQIEWRYLDSLIEKESLELLEKEPSTKSLKRRIWDASRRISKKIGLYEVLRPVARFCKNIGK